MDQPKRPADKSYSDVMNEWAAQRNLVKADRSRLLHPRYDAHPAAKFFGYLMRVALVTIIPGAIYLLLLRSHTQSPDFNAMIQAGVAETLKAGSTETRGAQWKFDGILSARAMKATGKADAFYEQLDARSVATRIAFTDLFRREWILPRVSIGELSLALRSGGLGKVPLYQLEDDGIELPSLGNPEATLPPKTGFLRASDTQLLRAGLGIDPDFKSLKINAVQTARLNTTWGSGPATTGSVTGMQTDMTRTATGWVISGNGGSFRQSWLNNLIVEKLAVDLGPAEAVIREVVLKRATGGGQGILTGRIKLGELPEVDASLDLQEVALESLVPATAASLFTAKGNGQLKLSGSVNRASGIQMEGEFQILSGRLAGLPVLKVLHQLTGEDQFRLLGIKSGKARFTTSGNELHGGLLVDVHEFSADCGALAKLKGSLRHEQIRQPEGIDGKEAVDKIIVSGTIKLGLAPSVVSQLKPAVVDRFLKKEDDSGWSWLEIPLDAPLTNNLTKGLSAAMLKVSSETP